jgi:hypothetical protein
MPTEISGSTGVDKIQDGTVVNADINSSAAIDVSKVNGALPSAGGTVTGTLKVYPSNGQMRLSESTNGDNKYAMLEASNGRLFLHSDASNAESNSDMRFYIDGTSYMKLGDSTHASRLSFGTDRVSTPYLFYDDNDPVFRTWVGSTSYRNHRQFKNPNGIVGSISTSSSSTSFNTSSDYRLKENVDYTWDATTRLKGLKPCRFNFIADEDNTLVDGFLAHEVSNVVPEAVSGEKDAVDENGDIKAQAIDHSKLVPLLVKTIQELEARIAALES